MRLVYSLLSVSSCTLSLGPLLGRCVNLSARGQARGEGGSGQLSAGSCAKPGRTSAANACPCAIRFPLPICAVVVRRAASAHAAGLQVDPFGGCKPVLLVLHRVPFVGLLSRLTVITSLSAIGCVVNQQSPHNRTTGGKCVDGLGFVRSRPAASVGVWVDPPRPAWTGYDLA